MSNIIIRLRPDRRLSEQDILSSPVLGELCGEYAERAEKEDPEFAAKMAETFRKETAGQGLLRMIKDLSRNEYGKAKENYAPFGDDREEVLKAVDGIYDIWRSRERYAKASKGPDMNAGRFISETDRFSETVIGFYRRIYENVLGGEQNVYRQLPSGVNAGFLLTYAPMNLPPRLAFLQKTEAVEAILIRPPFILSSKENKRIGVFGSDDRYLKAEDYASDDYIAVCLLIKDRIGYVYVRNDYLSFLVALGNLFRVVRFEDYAQTKPDFIVVFGAESDAKQTYYYKDSAGIYVGVAPLNGHIAYFGYLKKIILTLHNLTMIDQGKLPIHGAGISITLKNRRTFNIVILGDSGAGKSETIEALKKIAGDMIANLDIIYDDMGAFELRNGDVMTNGTETGAFVRLDDLDKGYSLRSVDRSIYMNIESVNSRVVIPIESYKTSVTLHHVDIFLLADNYTDSPEGLIRYDDIAEAEKEFIAGRRMAKGTTGEKGLVSSFFANPFGPLQRESECRGLIDSYFKALYSQGVFVGRLYTRLALDGPEGPCRGARAILSLLKSL